MPKGWTAAPLGELAQVNPEQLGSRTDPNYTLEYLDIAAIEQPGVIGPSRSLRFGDAPSRARRCLRSGDILVSTVRPYLRNFARIREPKKNLVASTGYAVVRPGDQVDGCFLYHHVMSDKFVDFLKPRMRGSSYPAVKGADVEEYTLLLPSLPEQRKIAAILSSVDDLIEKTQAVIDQVQLVKRGLMQDMLTRGLPGRHRRFNQTEIGQIPQEWEVSELSSLCNRMFVGIAQAATHAYTEEGVPLIRTTNIHEYSLDVDNLFHITNKFAREMKGKVLRGGDVLTARTGHPGTSVVVPESLSGAQCFTLLVSRPDARLRSRFLCHTMNSGHGGRIVSRGQAGGAQQNLNVSIFKRARVGVPSVEEQDEICDILDSCYSLMDREEATKEALRSVKAALMSTLLTGEVGVTPDTSIA